MKRVIPFIVMNYIGTGTDQGTEFYTEKPVRIRTKTQILMGSEWNQARISKTGISCNLKELSMFPL